MSLSPLSAIRAQQRPAVTASQTKTVLVLGGGGDVGAALTSAVLSESTNAPVVLFAKEAMESTLRHAHIHVQAETSIDAWLPQAQWAGASALIVFDPKPYARAREQSIWHPTESALLPLATWLLRCGVQELCVVMHHPEMSLPLGVSGGLMNETEEQLARLPFKRLILVRNAKAVTPEAAKGLMELSANWWFKVFRMMIPSSLRTVPHSKLATLVAKLMRYLPSGTHVVTPEQIDLCRQLRRAQIQLLAQNWQHSSSKST